MTKGNLIRGIDETTPARDQRVEAGIRDTWE
jgi:hypothetical protein